MLVYSYVRMSSTAQTKGDSERRQIEQAKAYAEKHGYTMAPAILDLGVSAFKGANRKKGALGGFLKAIKEGLVQPGILVIEAVDRLSREEPMDILMLLRDILSTGMSIHLLSLNQTIDQKSFAEVTWLLPAIASMAGLAHTESKQKSQRIEAAYRERQRQARQGVTLKGNYHPAWLRRVYHPDGTVEHVIIEEVAAAVRRVFQLAATGMGSHSIARTLNSEGVPVVPACFGDSEEAKERAANRRWYQAYVGRLTLDRRVLGEYQPKKTDGDRSSPLGDPIPGHFPAIISQEVWDQVQAAKHPKHGKKTGGRKLQMSNLFTGGMAKCDHCGEPMRILGRWNADKTKERLYLRCASHQEGGNPCDNKRTPRYDWFEKKFFKALPDIPWRGLLQNIEPDDGVEAVTRQIEEISVRIDSLQKVSTRLLRLIESEDEPDAEIFTRRREIQADIGDLLKRKDVLIRDREGLRLVAGTDEHVVDEAAELILMMEGQSETELFITRQKLHVLLWRIVEGAYFTGYTPGTARVLIRGGLILTIPLDEFGEVRSGYCKAVQRVLPNDGIPPLEPNEAGTQLIAAE
ncbi:recombinase family protein [Methylobacterium terricola]|uniref:recombinase family protein n=1 Tax=Methylobacterium terricola TaxID=2583531 RepID=UPI00197C28A4|nr:recombinase family protein [Methylobacterium terricola]